MIDRSGGVIGSSVDFKAGTAEVLVAKGWRFDQHALAAKLEQDGYSLVLPPTTDDSGAGANVKDGTADEEPQPPPPAAAAAKKAKVDREGLRAAVEALYDELEGAGAGAKKAGPVLKLFVGKEQKLAEKLAEKYQGHPSARPLLARVRSAVGGGGAASVAVEL